MRYSVDNWKLVQSYINFVRMKSNVQATPFECLERHPFFHLDRPNPEEMNSFFKGNATFFKYFFKKGFYLFIILFFIKFIDASN